MMLRRWVVCSLVFGASVVHAQPAPEGPPVPPETENAMRGRAAAVGVKGGAASTSPPSAAASATPSVPEAAAAPAKGRSMSASATTQTTPANATSAETQPSASAAGVAASGPEDALRSFPPAPPPSDAPPPPAAALTSFAPAPAPPPGGAPVPASPDVEAVSGTEDVASTAGNSLPAAASGSTSADEESTAYAASGGELWSASALAGVGVTFDNTVAGVNPLGFGFGVRGDYRVLPSWSIGARMLYFVGGSVQLPASDVAMQSWLIAAEGAYVIELNKILIQPGIALGLHVREIDYRGFAGLVGAPEMLIPPDTTRLGLYVAPGVNVAVPLGLATPSLAPLIVGADFRLDVAFGKSVTSNVQLLVLAGFQF